MDSGGPAPLIWTRSLSETQTPLQPELSVTAQWDPDVLCHRHTCGALPAREWEGHFSLVGAAMWGLRKSTALGSPLCRQPLWGG